MNDLKLQQVEYPNLKHNDFPLSISRYLIFHLPELIPKLLTIKHY